MEQRGFFGALIGALTLPLIWWRYPPVVWLDMWPACTPRPQPKMEGDGPHVFKYRPPDAATWARWSPLRRQIWEKNKGMHHVTWEVDRGGGDITMYLQRIDHRPTWAEVREILARKAKS